MAGERHAPDPDPGRRLGVIVDVDADLTFDGPVGGGTLRAGGGRLVLTPDGWRTAVRLGWWALRYRGRFSGGRRVLGAAGLQLYVKLPGLPHIGLPSRPGSA